MGHIDLPRASRGATFSALARYLRSLIVEHQIEAMACEAPILPQPFQKWNGRKMVLVNPTNIATTTLLQGLFAVAQLVAHDAELPFEEVNVSEAKRELAGFGGADKPDMVFVAEKVGLKIEVHDEADAFASWLVGLRRLDRARSAEWDRRIYSSRGALL